MIVRQTVLSTNTKNKNKGREGKGSGESGCGDGIGYSGGREHDEEEVMRDDDEGDEAGR